MIEFILLLLKELKFLGSYNFLYEQNIKFLCVNVQSYKCWLIGSVKENAQNVYTPL